MAFDKTESGKENQENVQKELKKQKNNKSGMNFNSMSYPQVKDIFLPAEQFLNLETVKEKKILAHYYMTEGHPSDTPAK